jgi:hypothetical protein
MIRNLHLMKPSTGPIMIPQFYYRSEPYVQVGAQIDRIIYGEPYTRDYGPDEQDVPYLMEYTLTPEDPGLYVTMDEKINKWQSLNPNEKAPLQTAIAYFENADRQLAPCCSDPFDVIEPLMCYEAALEALLVAEDENGVENKLADRVQAVLNDQGPEVGLLIRRVFWLRSKVAHGVRSQDEIRRLIIDAPDEAIVDSARKKTIPSGPYSTLFLEAQEFPAFLVNLRECTRRVIRYFLDAALQGETKEHVLRRL